MIAYRASVVRPVAAPDIPDGAVVVHGDRIAWVGAASQAPAAELNDLGAVVLGPGLVNAHTHLDLTLTRGLLGGLGFLDWIRTVTRLKRAASAELLFDSALAGIHEGLRHGVTTYADTSDNDAALRAMASAGVRGVTYREVFGPDPAVASAMLHALQQHVAAMRSIAPALVRVGISPHAPYSVSDALYRAAAHWARVERLPMAVHIAESEDETLLVREGRGEFAGFLRSRGIDVAPRSRSPIALLDACGVLEADPLLIHCVQVDDTDIASIARHDCGVAHCPRSNAAFRHGTSPAAALRAAGIRIAIGTDSVALLDGMDPLAEATVAARLAGAAAAAAPPAMAGSHGAAALLRWVSLDSARALGIDSQVGSLEAGKQADLAAFPLPPRTPYAASVMDRTHDAVFVAVAGQVLVRNGRILRSANGLEGRLDAHRKALMEWRRRDTNT